jgi:hypothetical protein
MKMCFRASKHLKFQFVRKPSSADKTMLVINLGIKFNHINSTAVSINVVRHMYGDEFWNVARNTKARWKQRHKWEEDSMWQRIFAAIVEWWRPLLTLQLHSLALHQCYSPTVSYQCIIHHTVTKHHSHSRPHVVPTYGADGERRPWISFLSDLPNPETNASYTCSYLVTSVKHAAKQD